MKGLYFHVRLFDMSLKKIVQLSLISILIFSAVSAVSKARATETTLPSPINVRAQVVKIISQQSKNDDLTGKSTIIQQLELRILDGSDKDKHITLKNDYTPAKVGDIFFVSQNTIQDLPQTYKIQDAYRIGSLYFFLALFILVLLLFGGKQGLRGLISLSASLFFIVYLLLPQLFKGISPITLSIAVSSLIIIVSSYVTHGFNRTTTAAVVGMIVTITLVGGLAYYAVHVTKLTGFETEESIYLNMDTQGHIDMQGLLLGGMLIGLLGVLYDMAIGQAIAVEELYSAASHFDRKTVYRRALRIGREHIGALVNTLAIAYIGSSMPLILLLFYDYPGSHTLAINSELIATEIIRILIGSIGIIIAVPITTFIATTLLVKKKKTL